MCFRKHSSGDLHSRLKTRKLLGVGETDDGDVHRSKVSVQCHTHYTSMNEMLDVVWVDLTVEVAYIPANTICDWVNPFSAGIVFRRQILKYT